MQYQKPNLDHKRNCFNSQERKRSIKEIQQTLSLNKDLLENRLVDIQIVSVAVLAHCVMTKVLTLIMFYVFIASLLNNTFGSIHN